MPQGCVFLAQCIRIFHKAIQISQATRQRTTRCCELQAESSVVNCLLNHFSLRVYPLKKGLNCFLLISQTFFFYIKMANMKRFVIWHGNLTNDKTWSISRVSLNCKNIPTQMAKHFHMSKLHNWSHFRRHALTLSSLLCKAERIFGLTMRTTSKEEKKVWLWLIYTVDFYRYKTIESIWIYFVTFTHVFSYRFYRYYL